MRLRMRLCTRRPTPRPAETGRKVRNQANTRKGRVPPAASYSPTATRIFPVCLSTTRYTPEGFIRR